MNEHPAWPFVERSKDRFKKLSKKVWATPETCYGEHRSVAAHIEELAHQGFVVTENIADIPTAVMGEAGAGGPVIAILGEYDALAGLSQEADVFEQVPLDEGGNGHGCGHNLLGSASMLAAVAVKNWLEETGIAGRIRYYGCPAEEGGAAKTFMVRNGTFDDVDIAISWHPGCIPGVTRGSSLANCRIDFTFMGHASHAAATPHLGRSALDAVELMSVGVNYMREHMRDDARIHYAIIDGGGISPNVVQAKAIVRYVVRAATTTDLLKLVPRVLDVAQGAALMTGTKVKHEILSAVSNLLFNKALGKVMQGNLDLLGAPAFTKEDHEYATRMQETLSEEDIEAAYTSVGLIEDRRRALADFVVPTDALEKFMLGSTDVADVSWVVPTVQLWGANYAIGTPFHSWQMVAQGKSNMAELGMIHAATAMAATAVDTILDPDLRQRAGADLKKMTGKVGYICPLSKGAKPPITAMA
jgi:aminobenzoyl-glutamate utilization protein B